MKRVRHKHRRLHISPVVKRRLIVGGLVTFGLFLLINVVLWVVYRSQTYPNTKVAGHTIGTTSYDDLAEKVNRQGILPDKIQLTKADKKADVTLKELGIRQDAQRSRESAGKQRHWLPIVNLFKSPELEAPLAIDDQAFQQKAKELEATFSIAPLNARLNLQGTTFGIENAKPGQRLNVSKLKPSIMQTIDKGEEVLPVPTDRVQATVTAADLKDDQQLLQAQLATGVTFAYNGRTKQSTVEDRAKWFVPSNELYVLSNDAIRSYITAVGDSFGIRVKDINQMVTNAGQILNARKAGTVTLAAQIALKTYTYCTAVRSVDPSHLAGLRSRLQNTFADTRGWGLEGLLGFKEVASGCDFTVWLSDAAQMPTFGAICDSLWSCRVGPNVVINFDRWQNASSSWNANGGSLEDYRRMVINHETGHWLGFGHSHCPGAGQPAPVMQQQSIDLQGCTFNPWPTASERNTLKQRLGI